MHLTIQFFEDKQKAVSQTQYIEILAFVSLSLSRLFFKAITNTIQGFDYIKIIIYHFEFLT